MNENEKNFDAIYLLTEAAKTLGWHVIVQTAPENKEKVVLMGIVDSDYSVKEIVLEAGYTPPPPV